jgi:hypothetical protein
MTEDFTYDDAVPGTSVEEFPYQRMETNFGVWQWHLYPDGRTFSEFRSHQEWFGYPLVHITRGICPETNRRKTARGIIAIGRIAIGGLAIGQLATGIIAIGQAAVGLLLGIGQFTMGIGCLGQFALSGLCALGQFTTGYVTIGQFAFGEYVIAQFGWGSHVIDTSGIDPEAEKFFRQILP